MSGTSISTQWQSAMRVGKNLFREGRPFSFLYGGRPVGDVIGGWHYGVEVDLKSGRTMIGWRDPETRLCVTAAVRQFDDPAAVYYEMHLTNEGKRDTPILQDILPLDISLGVIGERHITLSHANGGSNAPDDFLPRQTPFWPESKLSFTPQGGCSSKGLLPFFNLVWDEGGLILGIGWSGQWRAQIDTVDGVLHLRAGMEKTHLRLHAGERIRTPGILLLPWEGENRLIGQNIFRRQLRTSFVPRQGMEPILPPVACNAMLSPHTREGGEAVSCERTQVKAIEQSASLGLEVYTLDRCWFPGGFPEGVGNWSYRLDEFPRGLRPLGEAARAAGMKFGLWFEPERVSPETQLDREHPEWLLSLPDRKSKLFDLGNPKARQYMTDLVSKIIRQTGAEVYRHDFDLDPLEFWRSNDEPDRQGMTEIRHIQGLYAFWDELRRRHPGLCIESDGRRIDLESCSRCLMFRGGETGEAEKCAGEQTRAAGLSLWLPFHAAGVREFEPYCFRGVLQAGTAIFGDPGDPAFPRDEVRAAVAELKSLRPLFQGDFYLLTEMTADESEWFAWQYHRADLNQGFAVYFRRAQTEAAVLPAGLRGVKEEEKYRVRMYPSYREEASQEMSGGDLSGYSVEIDDRPASLLLRYEMVKS